MRSVRLGAGGATARTTDATDRMLVFDERHPRSALAEYESHDNGR
ncbi:hypothetical protein [Streptomyces sp. NPDC058989]